MRTLLTLLFTAMLIASPRALAQENCTEQTSVKVNGLVCDFCARAVEKVVGGRDDVNAVKVNLDDGKVTISMKPGKRIDDKTLTSLITDSGYDVVSIDRGC